MTTKDLYQDYLAKFVDICYKNKESLDVKLHAVSIPKPVYAHRRNFEVYLEYPTRVLLAPQTVKDMLSLKIPRQIWRISAYSEIGEAIQTICPYGFSVMNLNSKGEFIANLFPNSTLTYYAPTYASTCLGSIITGYFNLYRGPGPYYGGKYDEHANTHVASMLGVGNRFYSSKANNDYRKENYTSKDLMDWLNTVVGKPLDHVNSVSFIRAISKKNIDWDGAPAMVVPTGLIPPKQTKKQMLDIIRKG